MYDIILSSLTRQDKALAVLFDLLEEEYTHLMHRDTDSIAANEFSIQELIRQLVSEKHIVIKALGGIRASQYAETLPEEQARPLLDLLASIDNNEQNTSRNASRNAQLSLALLDQSTRNLNKFTEHAVPKTSFVYGRRGAMRTVAHSEASLLSGRL